ncbi:unnamed protein product [Durusdinium trenchii]|uniref:Uncharacterized protein n=1 Tax=Durusdinium trenchii TaxID=1381693 RepID=A0ABP0HLF5_9DINO
MPCRIWESERRRQRRLTIPLRRRRHQLVKLRPRDLLIPFAGCLRKLCREVAQRVNTKHFASWSLELVVLQEMKDIAQQFPKDAKTALERLRTLLLAKEGVTAFEVTCSGVSAALSAFLFPEGDEQLKEHLRLFLDHFVTPPGGALVKLVKLCVSSLQRAEQQPLMLFPTQASPAMYLPRHLSVATAQTRAPSFDGLMRLSSTRSLGGASSPLLSVLRLLAKPVKVLPVYLEVFEVGRKKVI